MLKKTITIISKFLTRTFSCFSLITLSMALIGSMMNTDELYKYLAVKQIITFFVFSLLFALSFLIADFIRNNVVIKRCMQFVLTYISLVAVFFFGGSFSNYIESNSVQNKGFSILSISFMFVMIYVFCAVIVLICLFIKNRIVNSNKEYKSILEENK